MDLYKLVCKKLWLVAMEGPKIFLQSTSQKYLYVIRIIYLQKNWKSKEKCRKKCRYKINVNLNLGAILHPALWDTPGYDLLACRCYTALPRSPVLLGEWPTYSPPRLVPTAPTIALSEYQPLPCIGYFFWIILKKE